MIQFKLPEDRFINMIKHCMLLPLLVLCFLLSGSPSVKAQNPVEAIRQLKEGTLVVRFPSFKDKIDTLQAMIHQSSEGAGKKRLQMLLDEAIYERDSVRMDYILAFQNKYDFSKVAYFFDHDSRDLTKTRYYGLNGEEINTEDLYSKPVFYLFFERTGDSRIDALVIYNELMQKPARPFPNNFTRGGFTFLFIKLTNDPIPEWHVYKINKKLSRFWGDYN